MATAIITDLNRCVGCLACATACKGVNNVPIGNYWNKVVRVGPNPIPGGSGDYPDVYMYFLPISCQHCENPECVKVCPTEASHVAEDGPIQVDMTSASAASSASSWLALRRPLPQRGGEGRREVPLCEQKLPRASCPSASASAAATPAGSLIPGSGAASPLWAATTRPASSAVYALSPSSGDVTPAARCGQLPVPSYIPGQKWEGGIA